MSRSVAITLCIEPAHGQDLTTRPPVNVGVCPDCQALRAPGNLDGAKTQAVRLSLSHDKPSESRTPGINVTATPVTLERYEGSAHFSFSFMLFSTPTVRLRLDQSPRFNAKTFDRFITALTQPDWAVLPEILDALAAKVALIASMTTEAAR